MQRAYRVGRSCQAWCTKCRMELEHTIVAMVDRLPKRVQCDTCGSQHNFRLAPRKKMARGGGNPRRVSRKTATWEVLVKRSLRQTAARPYAVSELFEVSDIINHPHFGVGVVQTVQAGDKIEVLFESGLKLLVHGR